jgi:hypothetical protein
MREISCLAAKFTVSFSRRTLLHGVSKFVYWLYVLETSLLNLLGLQMEEYVLGRIIVVVNCIAFYSSSIFVQVYSLKIFYTRNEENMHNIYYREIISQII